MVECDHVEEPLAGADFNELLLPQTRDLKGKVWGFSSKILHNARQWIFYC